MLAVNWLFRASFGGCVACAAMGLCVFPAAGDERPNFVLLMADDQGWGDVGYYGHPVLKTPVLDEMAAAGLRLDRFYAAAPVCSPTRGSVMTGRHPNRFGCFSWGHTLRPEEITVAEALKTAGYTTGHFGKWHIGSVEAGCPVSPGGSGFDEWLSAPNFYENNPLMSRRGRVVRNEGEGSHVTVEAAIGFVRQAVRQKRPFLAVVWFGSPHAPHIATDEYRAMYADQPAKLQNFYGEITAMDHAIGLLREELRRLGAAENTLVWYTSDNGALPVGSAGGLRGRKGALYEGGLRVPTVIEWPARIREPRVSEVLSGTVDIYPTLLDLAGVAMREPPPLDGVSLVPLIDGKMRRRDTSLGFWVYPVGGIGTPSEKILEQLLAVQEGRAEPGEPHATPHRPEDALDWLAEGRLPGHAAWNDGRYKLHRLPDKDGVHARYELYDLTADAAEENDLADRQPERVVQMKAALAAWQESVVQSLRGADYR